MISDVMVIEMNFNNFLNIFVVGYGFVKCFDDGGEIWEIVENGFLN